MTTQLQLINIIILLLLNKIFFFEKQVYMKGGNYENPQWFASHFEFIKIVSKIYRKKILK